MEVGAISENITVTGEAPLLDTSSVSSAQTFDTRMVESLPMLSNMPIMLTRFAAGVNPNPNQSLVSQGFVDGTTSAAGESFGGVGSNTYSIDGAANNSTNRRIATSPNSDMVEEMRVESSNFDASIGHGTGLQISMTTKAGANQYRGTGSYQYWTNKINNLNPSQKATFTDSGKALYDEGRSHNTAWTLGGPILQNKMFFFANYSYVNDFIPGKNQGTSTIPANEAHLRGDFSDLLRLPNPAQYQIYDPLTVRPRSRAARANSSARRSRTTSSRRTASSTRCTTSTKRCSRSRTRTSSSRARRQAPTTIAAGSPTSRRARSWRRASTTTSSNNDRIFVRGSKNTFIEGVGDWTYEVPEYAGLHSIDRSRPAVEHDRQLDAHDRHDGDRYAGRREPVHPGRPARAAARVQAERHGAAHATSTTHCAAQGNCMLPQVDHRRLSGDLARRKFLRSRARTCRGR